MKFILFVLVFGFFTTLAYADSYQTTLEYCNNLPSDTLSCPSFSSWQGVSLKDLKSIILPINTEDPLIQLEDTSGNIWTQSLETCKSNLSSLRGCLAKVDLTKPEQKSIYISIWDIKKPQRNLTLFIDGKNQLSLLSDEGDHFVFSLVGR